MAGNKIPVCPTCGNAPEFRIRSRGMNCGNAEVRCPYGHHRHGLTFASGEEAWARARLEAGWLEIVSQQTKPEVGDAQA